MDVTALQVHHDVEEIAALIEPAADLARLGLLDVVDVSLAPVTLGAGAPLLAGRVGLRPVQVSRTGDFAYLRYEVVKG